MTILGIDPGKSTGIALFGDGKLIRLETITPRMVAWYIESHAPRWVCFEDSRLQSVTWSRGVNQASSLKIARNIGMVDAICAIIAETCEALNIPYVGVSPKSKGKKMDAVEFKLVTGWAGKSNQHERDSAMVAWKYRSIKP